MFQTLYFMLLFILHSAATIFELLCDKWEYLRIKFNILTSTVKNNSHLAAESRYLQKLPVHLTVLLGREEPSLQDLANFIFWAIAAGIPFISFYDYRGLLKKFAYDFKEEVEKRKGNAHILWHDDDVNNYKNGFIGPKIHVKLLSPSDGREKIVKVCKELAVHEKTDNVDIKLIGNILCKSFEFPDPDLGVYCGKTFSLYDYPPWQLATTEFVNIPSHSNMHRTQFLELLKRFSRCEQRLGK